MIQNPGSIPSSASGGGCDTWKLAAYASIAASTQIIKSNCPLTIYENPLCWDIKEVYVCGWGTCYSSSYTSVSLNVGGIFINARLSTPSVGGYASNWEMNIRRIEPNSQNIGWFTSGHNGIVTDDSAWYTTAGYRISTAYSATDSIFMYDYVYGTNVYSGQAMTIYVFYR